MDPPRAITKKVVSRPQDLGYPGSVIQDRVSAIRGKVMQENIILLQRRYSVVWYLVSGKVFEDG